MPIQLGSALVDDIILGGSLLNLNKRWVWYHRVPSISTSLALRPRLKCNWVYRTRTVWLAAP